MSSRHAGLILIYVAVLVILVSAVACTDETPPAPNLEPRPPAADPAPDERTGTQGGANALPKPTQAPTQPLRAGDEQREWCGGGGGIVAIAEPVIAPGFGAGDPAPRELIDAIEDTWVTVTDIGEFELDGDTVRFPYIRVLSVSGEAGEAHYELMRVQPSDAAPAWLVVYWEIFIYCGD